MLIVLGLLTIVQGLKKADDTSNNKEQARPQNKTLSFFIKPLRLTIKIIKEPAPLDIGQSKCIYFLEAIYLGISLSIDSLVVGISYAIVGGASLFIPIYVGIAQFLFLSIGEMIGDKISSIKNIDPKIFVVISGSILILLSIIRMF